jgi:hypothetical protein
MVKGFPDREHDGCHAIMFLQVTATAKRGQHVTERAKLLKAPDATA